MTDLGFLQAAKYVKPVNHQVAQLLDVELPASSAPTVGTAIYFTSAGVAALSDASAAGTAIVDGIIVETQGRGATVITGRGLVYGFDLSGMNYGALVYLSDTAGALTDTDEGTVSIVVGKVWRLSDKDATKVLFVDLPTNV